VPIFCLWVQILQFLFLSYDIHSSKHLREEKLTFSVPRPVPLMLVSVSLSGSWKANVFIWKSWLWC
jgi:hypothetical protein